MTKHVQTISECRKLIRETDRAKELEELFFDAFKGGKINGFDTANGFMYVAPRGEKLIFGDATNAGVIPEYVFDYDFDLSFDENLQEMIEQILEEEGYPIDDTDESVKRTHEELDYFDLQSVLPTDYTVAYVTDLTGYGKRYSAWQIGTYNNHYFNAIYDEKIYREIEKKLKRKYPKEDVRVTSRKYKYAPEQPEEYLILLPMEA